MPKNRTKQVLRSMDCAVLYIGHHSSFSEALEKAVADGVNLTGLDARRRNLRCANLDGAHFDNANFQYSDLSSANFSEGRFSGCSFGESALFDTCFCYSSFDNCEFASSRFGVTDFSQSEITGCVFSGISALSVNFSRSLQMSENIYLHGKKAVRMSTPPLVIHGLKNVLAFFDDHVLVGPDLYADEEALKNKPNSRTG